MGHSERVVSGVQAGQLRLGYYILLDIPDRSDRCISSKTPRYKVPVGRIARCRDEKSQNSCRSCRTSRSIELGCEM
eukprot:scaffold285640_cov37-Attheya_sp.AAC.1